MTEHDDLSEGFVKGTLKVRAHVNIEDRSLKMVTENNKEYSFTDTNEALWYFRGLGYFQVRLIELFLKVPKIQKTLHFEERHDPRLPGIDGYTLYLVTPITEEEWKILEDLKKKGVLPALSSWKSPSDYVT